MLNKALSLLRRDNVAYADMIYPILRGEVDSLQADEDGVVLLDKPSGFLFAKLPNTEGSVQKLMQVRGVKGYYIHSDDLADRFQKIGRRKKVLRVVQAVYLNKTAPSMPRVCSVRPLNESDADALLAALPDDDAAAVRTVISEGRMYGAFIGGDPVGRICIQKEGCLDLLEVRTSFRRRGVGQSLTSQLIKELLSGGITPYCHIERSNVAATALAESLGFTLSERELTIII